MKLHKAVWIFVALHFGLAIWYGLVTPYRQAGILVHQMGNYAADIGAPDERQHVNYVRHLASGAGFPVFDPKDPSLYESYQSHQPPLFYLLAAAFSKAGLDGAGLRILNAALGAITVLGAYFLVLWGFRSQTAALSAAAFAALLPMNLALSGAVSNDPLLYCLCTWTLAFAARGIHENWPTTIALTCGALMGLAFLTKTTAVALWPAIALALYLSRKKAPTPQRPNALSFAAALGLPLLIAAPWWLRNQSLYGDPLAMKAFTEAFTGSPQASLFIQQFGAADYWITGAQSGTGVAWWTLRSFFGAFGYMDIFLPSGLYAALAVLFSIPVLFCFTKGRTGVGSDGSALDTRPSTLATSLMSGLFFFLVFALFLRFNAQYFQGQARYLLPAIGPIAAAIGLGTAASFGRRQPLALISIGGILLALNIYVLTILPGEFERRLQPPSSSSIESGTNGISS